MAPTRIEERVTPAMEEFIRLMCGSGATYEQILAALKNRFGVSISRRSFWSKETLSGHQQHREWGRFGG